MKNNIPSQIILYARTSNNEQDLGIDAQFDRLRNYCNYNDIVIIAEFSEKVSSRKTVRVELFKAAETAKDNNCPILALRQDRLGRDSGLTTALIEQKFGIQLYTLDVGFGDDPQTKKMCDILSAIAEFDRELISARITEALAAKKARGETLNTNNTEAQKKSLEKRKAQADERSLKFYSDVEAFKQEVCDRLGIVEMTNVQIAEELNVRQYPKLRGGLPGVDGMKFWSAPEVRRLLVRAEKLMASDSE